MGKIINIIKTVWVSKKPEVFFWTFAVLVLFYGLGVAGLWASEDRWAEIAREMMLNNDYLHPAINGEVYFDKPLLTYWLIVAVTFITQSLDEFAIRLPSALAALIGLYSVMALGRRMFSQTTGLIAGWILLSAYGFLFWGRTAAADMANLAAVIAAVAWFFAREDKPGFKSYFVFYLICFLGCMAKGLPAIIVPLLAILPWMLMDNRWRNHLRISNLIAFILGLGIYLLPFQLASMTVQSMIYQLPIENLNGLELVWRENILRAIKPFDHDDEPFFCYLYQLPRILLPWSLIFIAGIAAAIAGWRKQNQTTKWLLSAMLLIFLCFSASGSRRWYYILPIMPFCAILIAQVLLTEWQKPWVTYAVKITRIIFIAVATVALLGWPSAILWRLIFDFPMPLEALLLLPLSGAAVLTILLYRHLTLSAKLETLFGMPQKIAGVILAGAILSGSFFALLLPALDMYRTEKSFALSLKKIMVGVPAENIVFLHKVPTKIIFYAEFKKSALVVYNNDDWANFIKNKSGTAILIGYNREKDLSPVKSSLSRTIIENPVLQEKYLPGEHKNAKKLLAWKFNLRQANGKQGID
jgi:4-amino-4-deoxy-L-arabinose transferase-like glycosyltransferase